MNHTEVLTRYTTNFVDEIVKSGVQDVVISPGSRSTPLALGFTEHTEAREWVLIDERSAAFFALGLAKQSKKPVVLVCTSGTAAANYFPAIVEAYYSRVPLVVLTADRPHELRDIGAPQAIEQIELYGKYIKWFQEMAVPEASPDMLGYVRNKAARAVYMAGEGNPGPVHMNLPFREPLMLDFSLEGIWEHPDFQNKNYSAPLDGQKQLSDAQLEDLLKRLENKEKGLIVCGAQPDHVVFPKAVTDLAEKLNLPILADPLSQLRSGKHSKVNVVDTYDAILKDEMVRNQYKPDFIIRFGAMPVSKSYLFYIKENKVVPQFIVENHSGYREPTGNVTDFIFANPVYFCEKLQEKAGSPFPNSWLWNWQQMNEIAKKYLQNGTEEEITEGEAIRGLTEVIPKGSTMYVGNSMAIRDVDTFFLANEKEIEILGNRGANGIDGMISSAVGAAANGNQLTLVLGDLSFFHDMNGLLAAKQYGLDITILLINNNGGGIFSFLSQADDKKHFDTLFGTPADLDFEKAAALYEADYIEAKTEHELKLALKDAYAYKGISIVEVKTDRDENVRWHRKKWQQITDELLMMKDG